MNSLIFKKEFNIGNNLVVQIGFNKFNRFAPTVLLSSNTAGSKNYVKLNSKEWMKMTNFNVEIESFLFVTAEDDAIVKIGDISKSKEFYLSKSNSLVNIQVRSPKGVFQFPLSDWNVLLHQVQFFNVFFLFANPLRKRMYQFYTGKYLPLCLRLKKARVEEKELKKILSSEKEDKILHQLFCYEVERFLKTNVNNYIKKQTNKLQNSSDKDVGQNN